MAFDLTGSSALVTGGARRIGRACALALAGAGANVVVHHNRSRGEADELIEQIRALGAQAWALQADLAAREELGSLVDRAVQTAGHLDILINNASIFPAGDMATVSLRQLEENIRVNAWAPLELGRRFAAVAREGHIVNFLDTRIAGYDFAHVAYAASKHLLALFTRMMAIEFGPEIAVNAVAPGLVLPPEGKDQAYLESMADRLPLRRVGSVKDVTDAVLFLVTSGFITGQVIFVDGGRHIREANLG